MRTNIVFNNDNIGLSTYNQFLNKTASLYCNYSGIHYDDLFDKDEYHLKKYKKEINHSKVYVNLENKSKWNIKIYST